MSSSLIYIGQQETNLHYRRNSVLPKQQVKDEKKGSFRAPSESESESDNSQKPDNLFKDSVTFKRNATATVPELYPFSKSGFSMTTKEPDSNLEYIPEEETSKPDLSNSSNVPESPFMHFSEKEAPLPPLPAPAPTVHMTLGLLGDPSKLRSTNNQKVLLTLNKISDEAKQWKQNKVIALNANPALWHDWKGINTTFYSNREEVDTSVHQTTTQKEQTRQEEKEVIGLHQKVQGDYHQTRHNWIHSIIYGYE